jgi:hypothetical protein
MKTTKEVSDIPTWEEIGDAVGMNSDAAWAMNKRIMEKARLLLKERGISASDFFEVKNEN